MSFKNKGLAFCRFNYITACIKNYPAEKIGNFSQNFFCLQVRKKSKRWPGRKFDMQEISLFSAIQCIWHVSSAKKISANQQIEFL